MSRLLPEVNLSLMMTGALIVGAFLGALWYRSVVRDTAYTKCCEMCEGKPESGR